MINLGDKAKDIVTGFEGICTARTVWVYGCARIGLQPEKLKDGIPQEIQWFDENQLQVTKANAVKIPKEKQQESRNHGGPRPADKGPKNPAR